MTNSRVLIIPYTQAELPEHGVEIHPAGPILAIQTIQETEPQITSISLEDFAKESEFPQKLEICLQCMCAIDPCTGRTVDKGWAVAWYCDKCGYIKQSKEKVSIFLAGIDTNTLDPAEIDMHKLSSFTWVNQETLSIISPLFLQLACAAKRGDTSLRETFGEVEFLSYPGIYDALARGGWSDSRTWAFTAVRLDGLIFINHDTRRPHKKFDLKQMKPKERKVYTIPPSTRTEHREVRHHQAVRSDLCASSGRTISLCVISEFHLDEDNEPRVHNTGGRVLNSYMKKEYELGRALMMKLTGVHRVSHTYANKQTDHWTFDQVQALIDPELEQHAWNFLFETLSHIQASLPTNGEWCTVTFSKNFGPKGEITVVNKGALDPNNLLPYFREKFNI